MDQNRSKMKCGVTDVVIQMTNDNGLGQRSRKEDGEKGTDSRDMQEVKLIGLGKKFICEGQRVMNEKEGKSSC